MSHVKVHSYIFSEEGIDSVGSSGWESNWPVVYQIYGTDHIYIGETTNLKNRIQQHTKTPEKQQLEKFAVIYDEHFNKSVALDLESQLIQWFSGEGNFTMVNRNDGIDDREYYRRKYYRKKFPEIWNELRKAGVATKNIQDIENSGLFKFSPYKRLNPDQQNIVYKILENIEESFLSGHQTISLIKGKEGTGKTIIITYLAKLLRDIQTYDPNSDNDLDINEVFEIFFKQKSINKRLKNKTIALVIPNQSLRGSIRKIFKKIDNMPGHVDILSPIDFGSGEKDYDITLVDEAHLLKLSNQEVHKSLREKVDRINTKLFVDEKIHSELEWILKKSKNIVLIHGDQRIRQNNIREEDLPAANIRTYCLKEQMRSKGGKPYIDYLEQIFSDKPPKHKQTFAEFEFKLFDDFKIFVNAIKKQDTNHGLSLLVAGFAWPWKSKKHKNAIDIEIDGIQFRWNSRIDDYIGSSNSKNEIGSIYTVQGYDLNYCGVIIGNDLKYDPISKQIILHKKGYYDNGAKKRNKHQLASGLKVADEELLDQVKRTYRILMNRSVKGTYVYVCDPALRDYFSRYIDLFD